MKTRKRKPQPWDSLRTRIELEVYALRTGKSLLWVDRVLDGRMKSRRAG